MIDDLNMRVFEALGSKSFLITDDIPTIHDLFEDGKHLVLYKTLDNMVSKITYYLEHEEERNAITEAGYKEVMEKHTIDARVRTMLKEAEKLEAIHV